MHCIVNVMDDLKDIHGCRMKERGLGGCAVHLAPGLDGECSGKDVHSASIFVAPEARYNEGAIIR